MSHDDLWMCHYCPPLPLRLLLRDESNKLTVTGQSLLSPLSGVNDSDTRNGSGLVAMTMSGLLAEL